MMTTTTTSKGQKQIQELAGWPCPKSYHQWFNVQVVTTNKWFPSRVCTGTKSIFQLSLVCHWHWDQGEPQQVPRWHEAVWPLMRLREGMASRGTWTDFQGGPMGPPPIPPAGLCPALDASTGNSWVCESTSREGPQRKRHRASGHEDGLREQPILTLEKRSSGQLCLRPFNTRQWGTSKKNRDVSPRPAVTGQRELVLNWYRVASD